MSSKDTIENLIETAKTLLAVEQLEYYNKNWLASNDVTRSERKQIELKWIIDTLYSLLNNNNQV